MRQFIIILTVVIGSAALLGAQEEVTKSTEADQKSVALTIYNNNLGLVKDVRELRIGRGLTELHFMDVASSIDPTSVHIRSLGGGSAFAVLEQNYQYDLLSPAKLLDKYVGREITIDETDPGSGKLTSRSAKILSTQGGLVYELDGRITFDYLGEESLEGRRYIFPDLPPDLKSRPTLVWLLDAGRESTERVEASYLTDDINWKADYVLVLDENDRRSDMNAWVTIDNKSGATYRDAQLKLVAGEVQRVTDGKRPRPYGMQKADRLMEARAPQFEEEAFFEYHLYTLDRKTTVKDRETKQLSLVEVAGIPVTKKFMYRGASYSYPVRGQRESAPDHVGVFIEFTNSEKNNLGIPLPEGTVRVYKKDSDGALQFIGEDRIDHTPRDERVTIKTGEAFDVVAERKQVSFDKISDRVQEQSYEISIRNHKEEDISVTLIESVYGEWKIMSASHEYEKTSSREVRFTVGVPAGAETVVSYRIRITF